MLKRQRPSSPSPIPTAYGDDPFSSISGPSTFHQGVNMSTQSIHADPFFGVSRKRPRLSPDIVPGATGIGGSANMGRHTSLSSSVLSKRRRSPDTMDDASGDSEDDSEYRDNHQISTTFPGYQREGEPSGPLASRPTINPKRRRTTAPALDGSSRGWGADQHSHTGTGPGISSPTSYPYSSFDPTNPPPGWVLETQVGEYAQENAKLHNLHALRPRPSHPEETVQDQSEVLTADVDMEGRVVKERYEEHNKLLGSLFLERQRRLAGP